MTAHPLHVTWTSSASLETTDSKLRSESPEQPGTIKIKPKLRHQPLTSCSGARALFDTVDTIESRRSQTHAIASVDNSYLAAVRAHFGRHVEVLGNGAEGWTLVQISAHTVRAVAEQLAGWTSALEIVEPQAVRDELARIGTELTATYLDAR